MSNPIASPLSSIRSHYDAVVIGTGYGGAIAACRLAQARRKDGSRLSVCVLERGKERVAGNFPTSALGFQELAQFTTDLGVAGRHDDLFDFRLNGDMTVISGCGFGGTSLINAGVAIEPSPWVLRDEAWPAAFRADVGRVEAGMATAKAMLGSNPFPKATQKQPRKLTVLEKSAALMGADCVTASVNVSFSAHTNTAGVDMTACTGCGNCVMGCNVGAKNTTIMNYLPLAHRHGAELFAQIEVEYLERRGKRWIVHYNSLDSDRDEFTRAGLFVTADLVILGAGCMGTTEILLRSKQQRMPMSNKVGQQFSGNGDVLAFGYNTDYEIEAVGIGDRAPHVAEPPGPCISGIIDLRDSQATRELGMVLEDGVIPETFAALMPSILAAAATAIGEDDRPGVLDAVGDFAETIASLVGGAHAGAVAKTQTYLAMCHDSASGRLELDPATARAKVIWPGAGEETWLPVVDDRLRQATEAVGGTHVPNPTWTRALGHRLIVCHPLGGAPMGESATQGAVNHRGQVFREEEGDAVYPNLIVTDAAAIPRSLGCNPLLTISGIAERSMELLRAEKNWTLDENLPPAILEPPQKLGLQFDERMAGKIGIGNDVMSFLEADWEAGTYAAPAEIVVSVESRDLDQVLDTPGHSADLSGTLTIGALSADPMQIEDGRFYLFVTDPDEPTLRFMRYQFVAVAVDGREFYFDGEKTITEDAGMDLIQQTTTLYVCLYEGRDTNGKLVGKGVLSVHFDDLLHSLTTISVVNAKTLDDKVSAIQRAGKFFLGTMWSSYF